MLTLHYYSNAPAVKLPYWSIDANHGDDDSPVYSRDLIKEFDVENPPLEDELSWILSKGNLI